VFEKRVLRRIFGPKGDNVTRGWRKLHNEELHNLYSSASVIRMINSRWMIWAGHVARMREKRNSCRLLVGKTEGKRPLGRPRRRWVYNIKMGLGEMGWSGMDLISLAHYRDLCECGNEPSGSRKYWEVLEWLHNWWPLE
jgi:hypothetical protein